VEQQPERRDDSLAALDQPTDEDDEQNADRWYSHTACGQEFSQIVAPLLALIKQDFKLTQ
jgi:hypothetical protein